MNRQEQDFYVYSQEGINRIMKQAQSARADYFAQSLAGLSSKIMNRASVAMQQVRHLLPVSKNATTP